VSNPLSTPAHASGETVRVIESIPVVATSNLPAAVIAAENIPTPPHLVISRELARGGMGHVHPAMDCNLLRNVALKRLDKAYASKTFYRDSFIAEAQMNGQLEHPNIVPVHELAVDGNGVPYFTMKLVQGIPFSDWLDERDPGTIERVEGGIEILLKVCDALAYAHHRGVVHRDLKPANIMVGDFGQVYLMDWGLAKLIRGEPASGANALMNARGPVGTPDFMAPEQARGNPKDVDERSDVFGVAKRIRAIAEKATQAAPDARYSSIKEMQDAMRAFLHGGMHLPRKSFAPGEIIFREGDKGDAAYMIVAGRCRAYRTANGVEETLSVMEPGEAFGEMALILFEPRAASVVAVDAVTVLVLDQAVMNEGLGLSGWTGALVRALAQRFSDLEQMVRSSGIRRT
jgi:serine/threonine-protein kinase